MQIAIITAMTKNRVIGVKNNLPWKIPEELKYFRAMTLDKPIIMGSNTFRSLNMQPLKNRYNIVLTSDPARIYNAANNKLENLNNLLFVKDLKTSLLKAEEYYSNNQNLTINSEQQVMVIGGREVYRQFLNLANIMYLSIIKQDYKGDLLFPDYDLSQWKLDHSQEYNEFIAQIWKR